MLHALHFVECIISSVTFKACDDENDKKEYSENK